MDDVTTELLLALRAALAAVLGGLIGLERAHDGQAAGVRTHATVAVGACLFGLISVGRADADRIAAQVVSGIGFIGAGVIMHDQLRAKGLTTAATLWTTASVGLAVAYRMYLISALCTLLILCILSLHHFAFWRKLTRADQAEAPPQDPGKDTP